MEQRQRDLPGFRWDAAKNRYFRITRDQPQPPIPIPPVAAAVVPSSRNRKRQRQNQQQQSTLPVASLAARLRTRQLGYHGIGDTAANLHIATVRRSSRTGSAASPEYATCVPAPVTCEWPLGLVSPQLVSIVDQPRDWPHRALVATAPDRLIVMSLKDKRNVIHESLSPSGPWRPLMPHASLFTSPPSSLHWDPSSRLLASGHVGGPGLPGCLNLQPLSQHSVPPTTVTLPRRSVYAVAGPNEQDDASGSRYLLGCTHGVFAVDPHRPRSAPQQLAAFKSDALAVHWLADCVTLAGLRDGSTVVLDSRTDSVRRSPVAIYSTTATAAGGQQQSSRSRGGFGNQGPTHAPAWPVSAIAGHDPPLVLHRGGRIDAVVVGYGLMPVVPAAPGADTSVATLPLGMVADPFYGGVVAAVGPTMTSSATETPWALRIVRGTVVKHVQALRYPSTDAPFSAASSLTTIQGKIFGLSLQ
ncbi:hypothetical protein BC828DRAFT_375488 [Blastocladiella britannica]|nr:hypothetical protein BC828DRAFT_375488 [Blastocladiella britannica]